jgi:hypothetical protein
MKESNLVQNVPTPGKPFRWAYQSIVKSVPPFIMCSLLDSDLSISL